MLMRHRNDKFCGKLLELAGSEVSGSKAHTGNDIIIYFRSGANRVSVFENSHFHHRLAIFLRKK